MFSDRLDFIMELTGTQASALARACMLDASHISRLRNGTRPLPKNPSFVPAMSRYLAKRIKQDYQKSVLCTTLGIACWPAEEKSGAALIEKLLLHEPGQPSDITPILTSFTSASIAGLAEAGQSAVLPAMKSYYYGQAGKREAVLQFFDLVLKEEEPQTLFLFSDEEMSWLYDDPAYASRWASDFKRVLQRGNRVKIIHNTGRHLYELIEAVAKWVPVYMTGMIEPYHYAKLRDGVFQRTLFIAPHTAAIVSSSVMQKTDGMLNALITDQEAVAALALEYERFFALCRPLMRILTTQHADELWRIWGELAAAQGELCCMSAAPTLATLPEWVARAMQARAPGSRIQEMHKKSAANLDAFLASFCYTEIIPAYCGATEPVMLPCAAFLGAPGLCYTADELRAHYDNCRALTKAAARFRLIERKGIPADLLIYCKEGCGVIMAKTDSPFIAFAISEANITNAFWDYLKSKGETNPMR